MFLKILFWGQNWPRLVLQGLKK